MSFMYAGVSIRRFIDTVNSDFFTCTHIFALGLTF